MQVLQVTWRLQFLLCMRQQATRSCWAECDLISLIYCLRVYFRYRCMIDCGSYGGGGNQAGGFAESLVKKEGSLSNQAAWVTVRKGRFLNVSWRWSQQNVWWTGCVAWEEEMSQTWLQLWAATTSPTQHLTLLPQEVYQGNSLDKDSPVCRRGLGKECTTHYISLGSFSLLPEQAKGVEQSSGRKTFKGNFS